MAIGNLGNKVSSDDVDRVKGIRNPPEHEPGFEPDSSDDGFDDIFGDDTFGGSGDDSLGDIFGDSSGGFGEAGGGFGAGSSGFGGDNLFGSSNSGFGNAQQAQPKRDMMDDLLDGSKDGVVHIGKVLMEVFSSVKNRSASDFAYYSRNLLITGAILSVGSILASILGAIGDIRILRINGLTGQLLGSGLLIVGTGLVSIGYSALKVAEADTQTSTTVGDMEDISDLASDDSTDDYEENSSSIIDDLFAELDGDEDSIFGDSSEDTFSEATEETYQPDLDNMDYKEEELNYEEKLNEVQDNQVLNREILFNTFKTFFPKNTPDFADKVELDSDSQDFEYIETICLKALANVAKCEMEDINSKLESVQDSYFSYEIRLKRIKGINKVEDIAREMEVYFRESSSDTSVNATVDIEGDFYKIIVTKGVTAVVTFGDIFKQQYVCDFFLNTKKKIPIITGISELGEVVLADAKIYDTMMIAGKPRSGKSWYVLSILLAMMMFNTPEQVQFIIVDPKESNLFKTMALMPHVCGLHNDSNILEIMRDIIDNEGARRKKILADNRCDDIWALWSKGIKLPVLYLVIDEVITVKNNLGELAKEFNSLMQTIISQLPSQGIRLIFVPHRATGVVDKTNRTMISYSAAVRSNNEDVKDTLDIKKWDRPLVNQGDIAVKASDKQNAIYVRGASVTTSDEENTQLMESVAKAFYKMGVELPDMSTLKIACNRDEDKVREELLGGNERIQYNADNILNDL